MYCRKCGSTVPEGSGFCNACGTRISGDGPNELDSASQWVKADMVRALIVVGAIIVIISVFLRWLSSAIGLYSTNGALVLMGAVLSLAVLILVRTGATGKWSGVMLLLSGLMLAMIIQAMYQTSHYHTKIGPGLFIALIGALAIAAGSAKEFQGEKKIAASQIKEPILADDTKQFQEVKNVTASRKGEPVSPTSPSVEDGLARLKQLHESGALTTLEYEAQKKALLEKL